MVPLELPCMGAFAPEIAAGARQDTWTEPRGALEPPEEFAVFLVGGRGIWRTLAPRRGHLAAVPAGAGIAAAHNSPVADAGGAVLVGIRLKRSAALADEMANFVCGVPS